MATRVEVSKIGLRLVCDVSAVPVPRPRQVFPLPDLSGAMHAFLTLWLDDAMRAVKATVDATLPGGAAVWTLFWGLQGADALGSISVVAGTTVTIPNALASRIYAAHLSKTDGAGAVVAYPEVSITVPAGYELATDAQIAAIASNNILDRGEKPWTILQYQALISEWTGLDAAAAAALVVMRGDGRTRSCTVYTDDGLAPRNARWWRTVGTADPVEILAPVMVGLIGTFPIAPELGHLVSMTADNDGVSVKRSKYANDVQSLTIYLNSLTGSAPAA